MKQNRKYSVWIADEAARAFLGIPPASSPSRWVVFGEFLYAEETGHGFWLRVERVAEWKTRGPSREWTVKPPDCLIRWEFVITIQEGAEWKDVRIEGFKT